MILVRIYPLNLQTLFKNCTLSFSTEVPDNPSDFKLIILWNIQKIIKQLPDTSNVVVFLVAIAEGEVGHQYIMQSQIQSQSIQ